MEVWTSISEWLNRHFDMYFDVLSSVRHLILDEADRMLDTEFLPQIQEIVASCTHVNLQKALLSATLPAGAEKIAMAMLRDPIRVVVGLK
jgi:ATP-dependent RNA helicase DDX52/ROK1